MTKLTRRGALGLGGAVFGLAACGDKKAAGDKRPPFDGEVDFRHGVASGDPLAERVILWTRVTPMDDTSGAVPVTWEMSESRDMTVSTASGHAMAEPGRDYTVKIDAAELQPGTEYFYRFTAHTKAGDVNSPVGRARTLSASGGAPVKLAVVSCANWPFGFFNAYSALAHTEDLDAVVNLGDYIYEYGADRYGNKVGETIGRFHDPVTEIVTLDDYRTRYAQYRTDLGLQAAHAAAPWLCTWDDHETANNSYRDGAQNHNVEAQEGDWEDRKQAAVQAYLEWMPVRDPEPGRVKEALYRRFDFGDVATIFCLESRLTGRSDEISWRAILRDVADEDAGRVAAETMVEVNDPSRTMLGAQQEDWLAGAFKTSTDGGKAWQVLANQVLMAKVVLPRFTELLTPEQIAAQTGYIPGLISFSQLGVPSNLDTWAGFPAARERLYAAAKEAGAQLVTLTGDSHMGWANTLRDDAGGTRGVEFGCTSITSPGMGSYLQGVPEIGDLFESANESVEYLDADGHGFTLVTLTRDKVTAEFIKVSTILETEYQVSQEAGFEAARNVTGIGKLTRLT